MVQPSFSNDDFWAQQQALRNFALGRKAADVGGTQQTSNQNERNGVRILSNQVQDGTRTYRLQVGGNNLQVRFPSSYNAQESLDRILDAYQRQPENLRSSTQSISIQEGAYKHNERFQRQLGDPDFKVAALTRSGGRINFYEGFRNFKYFDHEFAHTVDQRLGKDGMARYRQAAEQDGNIVSAYARQNLRAGKGYSEDFSDFYAKFLDARQSGQRELAELRDRFPSRVRFLERLLDDN